MKRAVIWAVVCGCAALAVLSCQKEAAPPTGAELEGAPPVGQELLPIVPELAYTPEEIWAMFDEVTFDEMHWDDVDLTQDNNLYYVPPSYDPEWPKVWQFILPAQTNLNPRSTTDDITIRIQTHDTVDPNKGILLLEFERDPTHGNFEPPITVKAHYPPPLPLEPASPYYVAYVHDLVCASPLEVVVSDIVIGYPEEPTRKRERIGMDFPHFSRWVLSKGKPTDQ